MCGRYTVLTEDEIIAIREILTKLSISIVKDDFTDYDKIGDEVFPTNHAPIITKGEAGVAFENVKWGFKKWNSPGVIINARSETLVQKSMFAKHLETGRCVVPAGEFFEWERLKTGKRKYYAKDKEGNLLFMAGLYRDVPDDKNPGATVREFVIITKESTGQMAKIHTRQPVILRVDQIEGWLTGAITPEDTLKMEFNVVVNPCDGEDGQLQLPMF